MILGVERTLLNPIKDGRGTLVEVFREMWVERFSAKQVNIMRTIGGSMRGSHIHRAHEDWLYIADGRAVVGMRDCRKRSPTFGETDLFELSADTPTAVRVPPGVIHGVYFPVDGFLLTIESLYYDPEEEFKVSWSDRDLGIDWPCEFAQGPDTDALSLKDLMVHIEPWQREWLP